MYKVYLDERLMYAPDTDDLQLINPVVTLAENAAGTFIFSITSTHPYYDAIQKRKSIIKVTNEDKIVFQGIATESNVDMAGIKEITCEGDLTFFNDSIQRPARYQGVSVRELLEAYVNNHNAQVDPSRRFILGMVTVVDSNDYIYCYSNMETTMECLKHDLVDDLGGFFRIRYEGGLRFLDYLAESPHTNSQAIRLGVNLLDYKSNIETTDIATAIIPLGAQEEQTRVEGLDTRVTIADINGGLDYVFNQDAVDSYGWITKVVTFDNVTDKKTLKRKGEDALKVSQFESVYIELTAVDMHNANPEEEHITISDSVRVVSARHGMDKYFRNTKQTLHLMAPEQDVFTLGKKENLSLSARTSKVSEGITQAIKSITPTSKILNTAKENLTAVINGNGEDGNVVFRQNEKGVIYEILIMDTADIKTARAVLRINKEGIGFSSKGANGPFNTAWGRNGEFVADYITSGTMSANRIRGGKFIVGGEDYGDGAIEGYTEGGLQVFKLDKDGLAVQGDLKASTITDQTGKRVTVSEVLFAAEQAAINAQRALESEKEAVTSAASSAGYAYQSEINASTAATNAASAEQYATEAKKSAVEAANSAAGSADTASKEADRAASYMAGVENRLFEPAEGHVLGYVYVTTYGKDGTPYRYRLWGWQTQ